jgi:flagellar biosynthesis protein FlhB
MPDSNQTEKPTPRRLTRARNEGQFIVSRDMVTAAQFLGFVLLLGAVFPTWFTGMKAMVHESLAIAFRSELGPSKLPNVGRALLDRAFLPLAGLAAISIFSALAAHLSVTRGGISFKRFHPNFGRFNPVAKIRQILTQGPTSALQAIAMLAVFGATIYYVMRSNESIFLSLPFASLEVGLAQIGASLRELLWKATSVFILFAAIDYARQRHRYMKQLRMSKQEIKEEVKEMEGNPQVRGKIKRMRRDFLRRRMMKAVPTATAVIVNPTHFAVALRYDHGSMAAPVVVAKGQNFLALRIRQIAIENGVALVENPPLAQALYKSVDVGREIPPHLYRAVAEVLAYIHRLTQVRRYKRTPKN